MHQIHFLPFFFLLLLLPELRTLLVETTDEGDPDTPVVGESNGDRLLRSIGIGAVGVAKDDDTTAFAASHSANSSVSAGVAAACGAGGRDDDAAVVKEG